MASSCAMATTPATRAWPDGRPSLTTSGIAWSGVAVLCAAFTCMVGPLLRVVAIVGAQLARKSVLPVAGHDHIMQTTACEPASKRWCSESLEVEPGIAASLTGGKEGGPEPRVPYPSQLLLAGLLQLVFTVVVLVLFVPIFHSFWLGLLWQVCPCCILLPWQPDPLKLLWSVHTCHVGPTADDTYAMRRACSRDVQVIKFVAPVWYGARWQCEKVPKHAVLKVLKQQAAVAHSQEPTVQPKALDQQLPADRALA